MLPLYRLVFISIKPFVSYLLRNFLKENFENVISKICSVSKMSKKLPKKPSVSNEIF